MDINRRKVKHIVAHTTEYFSAIKRNYLHLHKQQNNVEGSQKHTVRKKSDLKELGMVPLYGSTYMNFKRRQNQNHGDQSQNTGSLWGSGPLTKNTREPSELPECSTS